MLLRWMSCASFLVVHLKESITAGVMQEYDYTQLLYRESLQWKRRFAFSTLITTVVEIASIDFQYSNSWDVWKWPRINFPHERGSGFSNMGKQLGLFSCALVRLVGSCSFRQDQSVRRTADAWPKSKTRRFASACSVLHVLFDLTQSEVPPIS